MRGETNKLSPVKMIGLVPTMGALHAGHLSLVQKAADECDEVIVSIFVNPTQFAPNEDFAQYPRTLERDLALLKPFKNVRTFIPAMDTMYPDGFDTTVNVGGISQVLEGIVRPTHFAGVATVVLKLLNLSKCSRAYFGQKDYQQVCVIKKMTADLNVPVEIVMCPIVREPDGLAMSSRNRYLSPPERQQALALSQGLRIAESLFYEKKIRDAAVLRNAVVEHIRTAVSVDYVSVADVETLQELSAVDNEAVVLIAAKAGSTRLIDNVILLVPL